MLATTAAPNSGLGTGGTTATTAVNAGLARPCLRHLTPLTSFKVLTLKEASDASNSLREMGRNTRETAHGSHIHSPSPPLFSLQGETGLGSHRDSSAAKVGSYRRIGEVQPLSAALNDRYISRESKCFILIQVNH